MILMSCFKMLQTIAEAVGDWYFDRAEVKVVDENCRHLVPPVTAQLYQLAHFHGHPIIELLSPVLNKTTS